MSDLKIQGTKAFIWDFFGKMSTHGMGFIVSIFLARLLEPSDFGLIAMVMVIIGIASVFTDVGLGGALIQRRRLHSVHYSSVFYFNVFAGLLLTIITCFSAPLISEFYSNEQLILLVQVMSFSFVINSFSSMQSVRLRKELNYALLTKIGLVASLTSGIFGISLAFLGAGVWSLVAQTLAQGIMYNFIIWGLGHWRPTLEFSWKALTQLWGFGFRMFISSTIASTFERLDFLIIGKLFAPSVLGYFQRAKSLNSIVVEYSGGSLMAVLFPILSKVQNDLPRLQNIILKSLGIISFVVFLLIGGLYLVAEELIVLLFSDKWLHSVEFFKILVLSGFGYPISVLLVNVLSSRGNSKAFLRLEIYKKLIASVNLLILYFWSIDAFLYGLIIQAILGVSLNVFFASREIKLSFYIFVKPIIVQMGLSFTAIALTDLITEDIDLMNMIMIIVKGSIFTMIYILLNYIFKTRSMCYWLEEVTELLNQFNTRKKF